jgi:integrase
MAATPKAQGGRDRDVARLINHLGALPLAEIEQASVDAAVVELFPSATPGTRNASVYTPVSAILHHAGVDLKLRRPKGAQGRVVTDWLRQDDAAGVVQAADGFDAEFGLMLRFLLFTGLRIGEVSELRWSDIDLESGTAAISRLECQPSTLPCAAQTRSATAAISTARRSGSTTKGSSRSAFTTSRSAPSSHA